MKNLSQNYAHPLIAAKQRYIVNQELVTMYDGKAPKLFDVVGKIIKRIGKLDKQNTFTMLDAACGTAYYSEVMDFLCPKVTIDYTGVDYNPGMVSLAHEYYPQLNVVEGNVLDLQFDNNAFDIVLSGATIAHVEDWKQAIRELVRVTRTWLILHRNPVWLNKTSSSFVVRRDYDVEVVVHRFNRRELGKFVTSLGMERIATYGLRSPLDHEGYHTYVFRRI